MTFRHKKLAGIGLAIASSLMLAGCYDDGYGYSGVSVGYGSGGYYGYDDYAYGAPGYYGWYDNFYYPGSGYYIYDRGGKRHRWNDRQRRYWEGRREAWRGHRGGDGQARNWPGRRDDNRQVRNGPGCGSDGRWQGRTGNDRPATTGFGNRVSRQDGGARSWSGRGEARGWSGRGEAVQSATPSGDRGGRTRGGRRGD